MVNGWSSVLNSFQHASTPPSPLAVAPSRASEFGSPLEVEKNGMLRASFGEDGKLDELEMMFDGVAVHQQLQRAMGGKEGVTSSSRCSDRCHVTV